MNRASFITHESFTPIGTLYCEKRKALPAFLADKWYYKLRQFFLLLHTEPILYCYFSFYITYFTKCVCMLFLNNNWICSGESIYIPLLGFLNNNTTALLFLLTMLFIGFNKASTLQRFQLLVDHIFMYPVSSL